jgi:hypothetical protein
MTLDPTEPLAPVPSVAPVPSTAPVPAPVVAVAPRARSGGIINILLIVAAALAVGGVAFAVGRSTAPASTFPGGGNGGLVRPGGSFDPALGGPGGGGGGLGGGGLSIGGTVTAIDAGSITLTLENGTERTFTIDGTTTYRAATDATASDVTVGDDVSVQVAGGGRGQAGGDNTTTPDLTAGEITVSR